MEENNLIKKADMSRIASEGTKIYEKVKTDYDPKYHGKFLAIDPDSGEVFLGDTSYEAVKLAMESHPDTIFYIQKIGFDTAVSILSPRLPNYDNYSLSIISPC